MSFLVPLDIYNRACQHCGAARIKTFGEDTVQFGEIDFAYDKIRRSEMRRNVWRFAIRRAVMRPITAGSTMLLSPSLWSSTTTYPFGAIVADVNGYLWQSKMQDNLNQGPGTSTAWDAYCGPMTVEPYDSTVTTGYFAGELVYKTPGDGTFKVYMSLISGTSGDPAITTPWVATTTYMKDQVVTYLSTTYTSLIDFNLAQTPTSSPAPWSASTTYALGAAVSGSDGVNYTSVGNGNLGNNPTTTTGLWTNTGVLTPWVAASTFGTAADEWLQITAGLTDLDIFYPIGAGPVMQDPQRNVFRLPANYLRIAPQDPKAGSVSFLGAPSGLMYNDWNLEGDYIVSRESFPIMLRFVADIRDVRAMDDMFCEGLAAELARAVFPKLAGPSAKLSDIAGAYALAITNARVVNGIETGPTEAPEDDYIATRL
ncbi:MAG TPA: hypothetical protein VFA81_10705 [Burkholderiales bacterium]|nr:hypothetical protein [Burkholderiales bacterium]